MDPSGRIRYANRAAASLLGQPEKTLPGSDIGRLGIRMSCLQATSSDAQGGLPAGAQELHLSDAEGKNLTVLLTYSSITVAGEELNVCVLLDVTELRRLERDVLADASGERGQFSREVHEGLAQDLTGVALLLSTVTGRTKSDVATLGAVVRHVNELLIRARALAGQISPERIRKGVIIASVAAAHRALRCFAGRQSHL